MLFSELDAVDRYDGIWACASILHLPRTELAEVIEKTEKALERGGVLYASFKYGDHEGILDMRSQDSREGHPWEMVMKYCALLRATQTGDGSREKAEEIMQIGRAAISAPKGILKEITEENEKEYRNTVYGEPFIPDPQLNFIYR